MAEIVAADYYIRAVLMANVNITDIVDNRISPLPFHQLISGTAIGWSRNPGNDARGVGGVRIFSEFTYNVLAVFEGHTIEGGVELQALIDDALTLRAGDALYETPYGTIYSCVRDTAISYPERIDSNKMRQYLGGRYRLRVKRS